jgi:lysophospholipase L1-like esterase
MDGVKRLSDVDKSVGISYMVRGFYAGSKIGGGQYAWDASKSKSDHNGWTVVAPEALASWDGSANTVATMLSWTGAGNGAFVMVKQGAYDKSTGLKNLRLSIAKTKLSEESTRVVMLGDSTFAGSGAGGVTGYSADARKFGPTVALKNVLTENGWSAYSEGIIGNQNAGDMASFCAWDTRFQNFGGWIFSTLNSFYTSVFSNSGSTSALRFTPSATFDTIRIWYAAGSGTRQFTVQANNAGSPTTVESGDPSGQMRYFDYTAPAGATYVDVRRVTGSINILGFEAYVSAVKGISLIQMGRSGGRIANALPSTTQWDALNCVKNLSPNLVVINLAINEWINNGDLGIYYSNLLSIATSLRASNSDVAIVTGVPTEISNTSTARQEKYVECLKLFSLLNNVVLIDTWGSIESKENYSLLYADFAHPNKYGYRDFAQNISKIFAIAEAD